MQELYKQSPRWIKYNQMENDIKMIAKNNDKFKEYMNKLNSI